MYLNTHTYYSLRYGVVDLKTLLTDAKNAGIDRLALTDINTTSACLSFIRESKKYGIEPVVGVDFRNGTKQQFVMLARDNSGFETINRYLSELLHAKKQPPERAPQLSNTFVIYPFHRGTTRTLLENEFIGIRPEDLDFVRINKVDLTKGVLLKTVTVRNKKDFNAHRLLRAIDLNTLLSKVPKEEYASSDDKMVGKHVLLEMYADFPMLLHNTEKLLQQCSIVFDFSDEAEHQNQKTYTNSEEEDMALLEELCRMGVAYRYPEMTATVAERIERELMTIQKMGFVSYFLMNWDIVSYARKKGYFYVGRGSGANSVVAYLLRITDVDPIELDLYFERFINLYRTNPPDFDIDFSWRNREEMTRYIFERFKHVALVATYNTFQQKAVVRELGKVFGLPKEEIDKLSKGSMPSWEQNELSSLVLKYAEYIHGFPSHLSVHASGIVISEKPIHHFSATFLPPKGFPTIQFDMHEAEDVGLFKFDILSQRGLSKIKDALDIIEYNQPNAPKIDIHDMNAFKKDERIKSMLRNAQAIGCFYVESPAMRMLLRKLQVDDYLGLVAASSVIRPGVAKSGMMNAYIKRFRHPELRLEAHPVLLELMPETFGVMVYQEDVIKVAHHFAGLTLGEADKMRRGMSGKFRSREEFHAVKQKFFENCLAVKKHSRELTAEVWRQTESFAGYAFAKGHSASYAVESYQCLFLKAYYPLEFMVATINNYGGFYSTELYVYEARKCGGIVHEPCVNRSNYETCIYGREIYLGFHLLKSFDHKLGIKIEWERKRNGDFSDLEDFLGRVVIGMEQLEILIRMDAFRFTEKDKRTLLWEAHLKARRTVFNEYAPDLFRIKPRDFTIPSLNHSTNEEAFDQIELLGFPLASPFDIAYGADRSVVLAKDLIKFKDQIVWVKGYLIHAKRTTTSSGERMFFGTFLDEEDEWLDTVHFPQIAARFPFRGTGVYYVRGRVLVEYDCVNIEVDYLEKLTVIEDPRYTEIDEVKLKDVVTNNRHKNFFSRANKDLSVG